MPTPRRRIHLADPIASESILSSSIRPLGVEQAVRRCSEPRCQTILARDNHSTVCSPCNARLNGTPISISEFLSH